MTNFLFVGILNNLFSQIIRPHTPCFLSLAGTTEKSEGVKVKIIISAKNKTGDVHTTRLNRMRGTVISGLLLEQDCL